MIDDFADGIKTACSWTRILTFVPYASSIGGAIGANNALGSTTFVRISIEIRQTNARRRAGNFPTHRVRAARRRLARI